MVEPAPRAPLRPLGTAEILDGAVRAVRRNPAAAFAMAVPLAVVRTTGFAAFEIASYHWSDAGVTQQLVHMVISAIFGTMLAGLLAPVFSADVLGSRIGAGAAWQQARGSVVALVALVLVVAAAQELGVVALFVGGAWLWGIWAVAGPALVVERLGPFAALGRSFQLTRTSFWRVWGIRTLRWVLTNVLALLITLPFSALAVAVTGTDVSNISSLGINEPTLFVVIVSIGAVLALSVTSPISAAVDSLLYADLRMRREGMDLVLATAVRA